MKTNDLKKGTEIRLRNGFRAELQDNKKGNIRFAMVYGAEAGFYDELGSVYSHDIVEAKVDGVWVTVEHTKSQLDCRKMNEMLFI